MKTFIWRNGRPEAQSGYNDDLVMAFSIAMYIRDTALKFRQRGIDLTRQSLGSIVTIPSGSTETFIHLIALVKH